MGEDGCVRIPAGQAELDPQSGKRRAKRGERIADASDEGSQCHHAVEFFAHRPLCDGIDKVATLCGIEHRLDAEMSRGSLG